MRTGIMIVFILAGAGGALAATLHVPADHASIQAGVDAAAPGDTVQVAAGTYTEQVVITHALALRGAGVGLTTIETPGALPHAAGTAEYRAIICADDAAGPVIIEDLRVDGRATQPATGRFVGIMFHRNGGRVTRAAVHDVRHTPDDVQTSGIGVLASLTEPAAGAALTLAQVEVLRFQKAGVAVIGRSHMVEMQDVTVGTDGVTSDAIQNGIELAAVVNSRLENCTVTGVTHDGIPQPDRTATGLLAINCTDLAVVASTFERCLTSLYLEGTSGHLADLMVAQPADEPIAAHGMISVTGPIEDDLGTLPAPVPTLAGTVRPATGGLQIYEVVVSDSRFDGGQLVGARGIGLNTFSARAQRLVLLRNKITRWDTGVFVREDTSLFGAVFGRFSGTLFAENLTWGLDAEAITAIDARGCQWGDPSGPQHATINPDGQGEPVHGNVLLAPWLTGNLAPLPLPQTISLADFDGIGYSDTVTVEYLGGGGQPLYGYSALLTWDPAVVTSVDVSPPSRGGFTAADWFFTLDGEGQVQVDAALGGIQEGIETGPLFTVTYRALGAPDGETTPLQFSLLEARDPDNQAVTGLVTDPGALTVDLQAPVLTWVELTNETLDHTDDHAKDGDLVSVRAEVTDGHPLFGRGDVRGIGAPIFGAPWVFGPPDQYDGQIATWNPRPVFTEPVGNGVRFFQVSAIDPAGNASVTLDDDIIIDNTPPEAVSGLVATAGHNQVALSWDDPTGGDLHLRHTIVRADPWGDYPLYATPAPGYPAGATAGDSVYTGTDTATVHAFPADGSGRDIVYYAVMAEDMAGNVGPVTASGQARTTSYRVGDIGGDGGAPGDGAIAAADLARLDPTLGRERGEAGFDAECDVAPADSAGPVIPVPDALIDLDDLMLVAMRHDHVGTAASAGDLQAALEWSIVGNDTLVVTLADTCRSLKGLSVVADGGAANWTLLPGDLLTAQPGPWFLSQGPGGCRAYLAVLGPEVGLAGTGELLRLVADQTVTVSDVVLDARDIHNAPLDAITVAVSDDPTLPAAFRAPPPYPNPFNPTTTIAFALPDRQQVRLDIHALDGRRICRLVNAELPAGHHRVRWHGRDQSGRPVASGTYVYRLRAGPWSANGKLGLIK